MIPPDRVDSGGPRSKLEGKGQYGPCCCGPLFNNNPISIPVGYFMHCFERYPPLFGCVFRGLRPIRITLSVTAVFMYISAEDKILSCRIQGVAVFTNILEYTK